MRMYQNHLPVRIQCKARKTGVPLSDLGTEWLEHLSRTRKPSTCSTYGGILRAHILPAFGDRELSSLTGDEIEAFLREKGETLAARTVGNISTVLRGLADHGVRMGYAAEGPAWVCPVGRVRSEADVFNNKEKKKLTQHLIYNISANKRVYESFGLLLGLYTGLRLGELCALTWGDLQSRRHAVSVRRTVQRITAAEGPSKTVLHFGSPKSVSSERVIPMPGFLHKLAEGLRRPDDCYVLTGSEKFLDPRTMQNRFKAVLRRCKLRPMPFHALRHTFATDCVAAGFDPKTLSRILGHADVAVTLNTYVHPSYDSMRKSMAKLKLGFELSDIAGDMA